MQERKVKRYVKRVLAIGPYQSFKIVQSRVQSYLQDTYLRKRARYGLMGHSWDTVFENCFEKKDFNSFWQLVRKKQFSFTSHSFFAPDNEQAFVNAADDAANNCFDLLGSGKKRFKTIPWHTDFKMDGGDNTFNPKAYYKDIRSSLGKSEQYEKDIKIPWELSRFQHLYPLGYAYQSTKNKKYTNAFQKQVTDWIHKNPYLLGPNWVCPMDVGLRAVSWVWAIHFFKDDQSIPSDFWQTMICSLYDHFIFLENNWEIYDSRTSNHYLSDLVGYFYLCYLFSDFNGVEEKTNWCFQEIVKEFEKQVFAEGTDYEGSTSYHSLVAELFFHAFILAKDLGFVISDEIEQKLERMIDFLDWCSYASNKQIQIGDTDSGKVLFTGITDKQIKQYKHAKKDSTLVHFKDFGLSIVKSHAWHISMRHHAYRAGQPSGHFHNDVGSITFAYNGAPIFVDPGSYLYTPSVEWRNRFRSVSVHNTFSIARKEPISLDDGPFYFGLDENSNELHPLKSGDVDIIKTYHDLFVHTDGVRACRKLAFDENEQTIEIIDTWKSKRDSAKEDVPTQWNFTFAPGVTVVEKGTEFIITTEKNDLFSFSSGLPFAIEKSYFSPEYGVKVGTCALRATSTIHVGNNETILIKKL